MVKIVNVLKASGLYTALIFALYHGAIFPFRGRKRGLAPSREAEGGHMQLGLATSLSRHESDIGSKSELTFAGGMPQTEAVTRSGGRIEGGRVLSHGAGY